MLNPLSPIVPSSGASVAARVEQRSPSGAEAPAPAAVPPATVVEKPAATPAGRALERVVEQAARELFPGREIAVESFFDKDSGRYVHRIADGESGEVLVQTPPDELLRFFASGRQLLDKPLLKLDA